MTLSIARSAQKMSTEMEMKANMECTFKPRSQWLKIDTVLEVWLKERQKLWMLYTEVPQKISSLKIFCQSLMDYIAKGHFEVLEKLALAKEICTPMQPTLDTALLENISKTTLAALNFNDKYSETPNHPEFKEDLSRLGEHLAHRMECEDKLLHSYFKITEAFT